MGYADGPDFKDFVDERTESILIEDEQHSITAGKLTYSLDEVPDTEFSISCVGEINGAYSVSFTETAPGSGCVYVNPLNGNVLHCSSDAPDNLTWSYYGRGTANNAAMLNQFQQPIVENAKVARQFWVSATQPPSQSVNISKGNCIIAGSVLQYDGGTKSFSSITFEKTGFWKAIRVALDASGNIKTAEGDEAASKSECPNPPGIPQTKTVAIVYLQDGATIGDGDIVNTFVEVPFYTGDPGSDGGTGDVATYQYASGVVSGDEVCLISSNTVDKTDASSDSRMPGIGFVERILDDVYCTVRSSGLFDFSGKQTSYDDLAPGGTVYTGTALGKITQTQNKTPGQWDQSMGIAVSSSRIMINIGSATRNDEGSRPDEGRYKYGAGVAEAEFVYLKEDNKTVDEAKADSDSRMPAIGVVDEIIDQDFCIVRNNYIWKTSEHEGKTPGSAVPDEAGTQFYISPDIEGQVTNLATASPDIWIQPACIQLDDAGTEWLIQVGPATKPEPPNPDDGYDADCDSEVSVGDAVYLDADSVAHRAIASQDDKKDVIGIVKAVNSANTRCSIVRPPNVYDPKGSYEEGEYFLSASSPGQWGKLVQVAPGNWKVRVGWGRGDTGGLLVDTKDYGKFGEPGDGNGESDPGTIGERIIGHYLCSSALLKGRAVTSYLANGRPWCEYASNDDEKNVKGLVLVSTWSEEESAYVISVLERGIYYGAAGQFEANRPYFVADTGGSLSGIAAKGKYLKQVGVGHPDGHDRLIVCPAETVFLLDDTGDPVPVTGYTNQGESYDPLPVGREKIRDNDGSTSSSPIGASFVSKRFVLEGNTVIDTVDFGVENSGQSASGYLEFDLVDEEGTSLLSTKAQIAASWAGARKDTIPSSSNSSGTTRAVVDKSQMPLAPGKSLRWTITKNGIYTDDPYDAWVIINKYLVKSSA